MSFSSIGIGHLQVGLRMITHIPLIFLLKYCSTYDGQQINMTHYRNYALHSNCFNQCYCYKYYVLELIISRPELTGGMVCTLAGGFYYACQKYSYTVQCMECEGEPLETTKVFVDSTSYQLINSPSLYIMGVLPWESPLHILCRTAVCTDSLPA